MPAAHEQHHISLFEYPPPRVLPCRRVEINLDGAAADEQHLLGDLDGARHGTVDVRLDDRAGLVVDIGELLGLLGSGKKVDPRSINVGGANDNRQQPLATRNIALDPEIDVDRYINAIQDAAPSTSDRTASKGISQVIAANENAAAERADGMA